MGVYSNDIIMSTIVHKINNKQKNRTSLSRVPGIALVSQAIRSFPRAHARGKGSGAEEGTGRKAPFPSRMSSTRKMRTARLGD